MSCYAIDGVVPIVHPSAYIHPNATLIGKVIVGAHCYVGPHASLRGDFGLIELKVGANVQDGCILHCFPSQATIVEENGHIGHGAVLHGCVVHQDALVGMKAVIMDGVHVGERAIVAASALVPSNMEVLPGHLAAGVPAKIIRKLNEQEIAWKQEGTRSYHELTKRCLSTMIEVTALTEPEAMNRATLQVSKSLQPLGQARKENR